MPDLSSDLASLKIDRNAPTAPRGRSALRPIAWIGALVAVGYGSYAYGLPELKRRLLGSEVAVTEVSVHAPVGTSVQLTSTGYVEAQAVSRVAPKVPGRVAAVHVREGDHVAVGKVLLELEQADREAAIQAARMKVAAAKARVATARANLSETRLQAERQRKLAARGVAPSATADDLEARVSSLEEAVKAAQAETKAADAEVAALRVDLAYMRVEAPIAGTVINEPPKVGELVGTDIGGAGDKVIEIADFDTLMVETDIPEGRLHMVSIGAPCEIVLDAFPNRRYRGEAVEISPRVSRAKATVEVKVKFVDEPEGVLPDMSARVSFLTKALDEAALKVEPKPIVPAAAVTERGGSKVVFTVQDGTARMRPVTVGEPLGGGLHLLEGPAVGTQLVANPAAQLTDGQRIKIEAD